MAKKPCLMSDIDTLSFSMEQSISALRGAFVLKKNSYEKDVVSRFKGKWELVNHRYYDCILNGNILVELKKGLSGMWFDMVRYAEIYLEHGIKNTWTVFLAYDKRREMVKEIFILPTSALMDRLNVSREIAIKCMDLYHNAPRGCNIQLSLTKKDLRTCAEEHGQVIRISSTTIQ